MPGNADRNLRKGNLSEELGVLMLGSFCAVAPVPRSHDVGIDVICTLLRPEGSRNLFAEESFYVQIKSASVDQVQFLDDEYRWFKQLELPYLLARVDTSTATLELFSTVNCRIHFVEADYRGIALQFGAGDSTIEKDGIRLAPLGSPLVRIDIHDIVDPAKLQMFYEVIKVVVGADRDNRHLIRVRSMNRVSWKTNELPTITGSMTLVNKVSGDQYRREVLQVLVETLRGSLSAFMLSSEGVAAISPLLVHAKKNGVLTPDDEFFLSCMLEVFRSQEGQSQENVKDVEPDEK